MNQINQDISLVEHMNLVIVGHVDHGKSTFIGRLLADTDSLPEGKLEQVKATCAANAKPFEYAFLLDALKDEQAQGITIDVARCFFKTKKRRYIIIDAPGHIEFLKNMVTGAARAEAALLLIDAKEGVRENSRRHGFLLSLLGIKQVVVLVNKMDLVNYDETAYTTIVKEYTEYLAQINVKPITFVPIAAFHGENIIKPSEKMAWYKGSDVLTLIDEFKKEEDKKKQAFRMPVQDIYKFTESGDDRRIVAGTIETGKISVGDTVTFYPSQKQSKIQSIERFNAPTILQSGAGEAIGVTLDTQIYITPGEIMCKTSEPAPQTGFEFKANLFWLGKKPMIYDKRYKLKIGTTRQHVYLKKIVSVLDASDLSSNTTKTQIDRHDVAECIFQTTKPIAFDLTTDIEGTSRFVIVDDYEISGGGIVIDAIQDSKSRIEDYIQNREFSWEKGKISAQTRATRLQQNPKFIVITGAEKTGKQDLAKALEEKLFNDGRSVYYLGISNMLMGLGSDRLNKFEDRDVHIRKLGELAHMFTDAGLIVISTISDLDDQEAKILKLLTQPRDMMVIGVGETHLTDYPLDFHIDINQSLDERLKAVLHLLSKKDVLFGEYFI